MANKPGYVFHLRGTSGSGKTYVANRLLGTSGAEPYAISKPGKVSIYRGLFCGRHLYILGDYSPERSAGGCDTIPTINEVIELTTSLERQIKDGSNLFLEGLLLAHSWGAFGEYAHETFGNRYLNMFLDTPLERCISRVTKRRQAKGTGTALDPARLEKIQGNIEADYHRVELCHARVVARGGVRIDIRHQGAPDNTLAIMRRYIHGV
jgi:uridine kinase